MLENYLAILKIRFGERLNWRICMPRVVKVRRMAFPPMLATVCGKRRGATASSQKIGGGEIRIIAPFRTRS